MKHASTDDVRRAAEELFDQQGHATTREVKERLRGEGLRADQQAVSEAMRRLAGAEEWGIEHHGRFRIYRPKDLDGAILDALLTKHTRH